MNKLILLFRLRSLILWRLFRDIPLLYQVVLILFAGFTTVGIVLLFAQVSIRADYLFYAGAIHFVLCSLTDINRRKALLLSQLPPLLTANRAINALLYALPFLLVGVPFFLATLVSTGVYLQVNFSTKRTKWMPVIRPLPSPFVGSSYIWHAQFRTLQCLVWPFGVFFIVMAIIHENFNLAIAAVSIISIVFLLSLLTQYEDRSFVTVYRSVGLFSKRLLQETVGNLNRILFLPAVLVFIFFPKEWNIILLTVVVVYLLGITLVWTKYMFFQSQLFALLFFFLFAMTQAGLLVTLYGIPLMILLQGWLYYKFMNKIKKRLFYEGIDNKESD